MISEKICDMTPEETVSLQ